MTLITCPWSTRDHILLRFHSADGILVAEVEFEATAQRRLESVVIPSDPVSIAEAIAAWTRREPGLCYCARTVGLVCGLLTDGDIRRAILLGKSMEAPCSTIASKEACSRLALDSAQEKRSAS